LITPFLAPVPSLYLLIFVSYARRAAAGQVLGALHRQLNPPPEPEPEVIYVEREDLTKLNWPK
jgi:hypothetical protein